MKKAGYNRYLEKLKKGGCKGDPFVYYRLNKENRLKGQEIRELIAGKTISGFYFCMEWSRKINKSGECVYTGLRGVHKGKIWIEGNELCEQYETLYDGLKFCAEIYRNPEGNNKTLSEYFRLTDFFLYLFSIDE